MLFPISTDRLEAGVAALVVGIVAAWRKASMLTVAAACCAVVLVMEALL